MLLDGRLDMGHARALLGVGKARQVELAAAGRRQGAVGARDRTPRAARGRRAQGRRSGPQAPQLDADTRRLQDELSESLGASVTVKPRKGGRGSLVIDYTSLEQLDGIVSPPEAPLSGAILRCRKF